MRSPIAERTDWRRTTLGDIGDYLNGRGFKKSEWSDRGRQIIRIQDLTGTGKAPNYFAGDCEERHVVRSGDLLISWAATLDAFVWRGPEAVLNQHIFKVRSAIDPRFHFYLVKRVLADIRRRAHGSGMVHITKREFESTSVMVPERTEDQSRIADMLEQQMTRIDAAQGLLWQSKARVRGLRSSVLHAAWSGKLMRGAELEWRTLAELSLDCDYGTSLKATYDGSGPPVVRIPNVVAGTLDLTDMKYSVRENGLNPKLSLQPGDLLVVRTNGSRDLIGRAGLVDSALPRAHFHASYLIRFRLRGNPLLWRWLSLIWQAPSLRRVIESRAATSAGQYNLNIGSLSTIQVPVPPNTQLEEAVAELERQLTNTDELERDIQLNLMRLPGLRLSVLDQALGKT